MRKLRVALIYGGSGHEHEVSKMGVKNLLPKFDRRRLTVYPIFIDKRGIWHNGGERGERVTPCRDTRGGVLSSESGNLSVDVAFPLLHGDFGEDGRIQGSLDTAHIPYIGCDVRAGAVCADKLLTKRIADSLGIPSAASMLAYSTDRDAKKNAEEKIGYPMFLKPSGLGSSVGCSLVLSSDMFDEAFSRAAECDSRVLVEEYVEGARELECAYLGTKRFGEIYAHPGEVITRGVYTYREKYGKDSHATAVVRADIPESVAVLAEEYSRRLVREIGISEIARIDYFLKDGELLLNEINTMPGFTSSSLYSAMLSECGIDTSELLTALIEDAYDRCF